MTIIHVFICDDHDILRKGLRSLLSTEADFKFVGEASSADEAFNKIELLKPDVILMDLLMPGTDGIRAITQICSISPQSKVLVLTSSQENDMILGSLEAGADGYLTKTCSPDMLIDFIRRVARGERVFPPEIAAKIMGLVHKKGQNPALTERETVVLGLIGRGYSNHEIAETLNLSENTVISHVGRILKKLSLDNRTQAALYAKRRGLV